MPFFINLPDETICICPVLNFPFSCSKKKAVAELKSEVVGVIPYKGMPKKDIDSIVSAYQNTAIQDGASPTSERKVKKMVNFLEGQIERLKSPA